MKNKTYNVVMILLCTLIGLAIVVISIVNHFVEKSDKEVIYINHIVRQNEYLDDIAYKYYPDTYVLKARADIKKINNMTESDLYEGQVIKVREVK